MPEMGDIVELPDSARKPVARATRLNDADPDDRVLVTVIAKRKAGGGFTLAEAPARGVDRAAWRREQRARFAAPHGADQAGIGAAVGWAREVGLQVRVSDRARRTVTLEGSVAQVNRAFGVALGRYEANGRVYRGRQGDVQVPRFAGIIDAVLGLDDRPKARRRQRTRGPIRRPVRGADTRVLRKTPSIRSPGCPSAGQDERLRAETESNELVI
jgi:kumamolisin